MSKTPIIIIVSILFVRRYLGYLFLNKAKLRVKNAAQTADVMKMKLLEAEVRRIWFQEEANYQLAVQRQSEAIFMRSWQESQTEA